MFMQKLLLIIRSLTTKALLAFGLSRKIEYHSPKKKTLLISTAILSGFFILLLPLILIRSTAYTNQLDSFTIDDLLPNKIADDLATRQSVVAPQTSDQTTPDIVLPNQNGSSVSVSISSNVSSSNGVVTETHTINKTVNDDSHSETITKTSDDGSSRVRFSVDVDANSESSVKVRERGDRLSIKFREKTN